LKKLDSWKFLSDEQKMGLLSEWHGFRNQWEIGLYYENSNGLGDWWATQEGQIDFFAELIESKKKLSEYPKEFLKWYRERMKLEKTLTEMENR